MNGVGNKDILLHAVKSLLSDHPCKTWLASALVCRGYPDEHKKQRGELTAISTAGQMEIFLSKLANCSSKNKTN